MAARIALPEHDNTGQFTGRSTDLEPPVSKPHARDVASGRFAGLGDKAMKATKTAFLESLAAGCLFKEAVRRSGVSYWSLWRWSQQDEELAAALDSWRRSLGLESLAGMQADMAAPGTSEGLQAKGANAYANFRMITAKTTYPDMREAGLNVNVYNDNRSVVCSLDQLRTAVQQVRQLDSGSKTDGQAHTPTP